MGRGGQGGKRRAHIMKRQSRITLGVLVIVALIFLFGGIAFAQDFSADMVSTTKSGVVTGKIFVTKEKTRMEMPQAITITRMDKNVVWILMPDQKMYMEQSLKPENVVATTDKMPGGERLNENLWAQKQ
ncbi:hypothetical protein B9J78_05845 [bacterium Unc6]|nr:hypothetical protein [bacterium Unc6]